MEQLASVAIPTKAMGPWPCLSFSALPSGCSCSQQQSFVQPKLCRINRINMDKHIPIKTVVFLNAALAFFNRCSALDLPFRGFFFINPMLFPILKVRYLWYGVHFWRCHGLYTLYKPVCGATHSLLWSTLVEASCPAWETG